MGCNVFVFVFVCLWTIRCVYTQVAHTFRMLPNDWAAVAVFVFVYLPLDVCMMRAGCEFRMLANGWEAVAVSFVYLCICVFAIGCVHDEGRTWMLANGWSAVVVSFACLYLCICVFVYLSFDVCMMRVGRECWQMDGKQLAVSCVCLYFCVFGCVFVYLDVCMMRAVNLECWQMDGKQLAGICHCLGPASAVHRLILTTKTHSAPIDTHQNTQKSAPVDTHTVWSVCQACSVQCVMDPVHRLILRRISVA